MMSFCRWMGLDSFMDYEEDGTAYDYNRLHVFNLFMHLVEASGSGTNRGIEAYYTELEVSSSHSGSYYTDLGFSRLDSGASICRQKACLVSRTSQ